MPMLPITPEAWLRGTSLGVFRQREPELRVVDAALAEAQRASGPYMALELDQAIRAYKARVPDWERSPRNRTLMMSRMFLAALLEASKYLEQEGCVWSPAHHNAAMKRAAVNAIEAFKLHPKWLGGLVMTDLSLFSVESTIYLLGHGHPEMPAITVDRTTHYTATQFVNMLARAGIRLEHRNFTLLICHAGESVNTKAGGEAIRELTERATPTWDAMRGLKAGTPEYLALNEVHLRFMDEHEAITKRPEHREPAPFENFTDQVVGGVNFRADPQDAEKQLLPMAAQLSAAMKAKGFTRFVLKSFKAPVSNSFVNGKICLDLRKAKLRNDPRLADIGKLPDGHYWDTVPIDVIPEFVALWH